MVKVGDVFRVKKGAPYSITTGGSVVQVVHIYSSTDYKVILLEVALEKYKSYEGHKFSLHSGCLEPHTIFQGPELPPVYLKIRSMHARQQEKGILRY